MTINRNESEMILRFYAYSFLKSLLFFLPIVVVFFKNCNLNFTEIFLLETLGAIGAVFFEVPTGVIADYFGKKKSLMAGMLMLIVSNVIFYSASGFLVFAIGQLIWALGGTLLSGADTALLYDVLHDDNKENFKKYQGTSRFIGLMGISLSSLIGGYISSYSMRITFVFTAIAFIICFFIIGSIKNIKEEQRQKIGYTLIITNSFKLIKTNKWLLWLFLYSGVFGAIFNIIKPLSQVYMNISGLDIRFFGIASTYFFLVAAISSKLANVFEKKFNHWSYFILGVLLIFTVITLSFSVMKLGFLLFGIIFFAMSICSIIIEHEILKISTSNMNSTVLSFNNLFNRLLFAISAPIFGYYLELLSFQKTMLWLGVILLLTIPIFAYWFIRIVKNSNKIKVKQENI